MSLKVVTIGSWCLIGILASMGDTAQADQINTHGAICQNFNASQALDIDYLGSGVRNINAASRPVICSVPRSPVPAGSAASFFVDGRNLGGTSTNCTLFVHDFLGNFKTSSSFTRSGTWDQFVSFPAGTVTTFDYVSVLCTLPGSGNGILGGITSV